MTPDQVINKHLTEYFKVLENDGALEKYYVTPTDIEFVVKDIMEELRQREFAL